MSSTLQSPSVPAQPAPARNGGSRGSGRRPAGFGRLAVALLAVLVGLAAGRFALSEPASAPARPAAPLTAAEQIAELERSVQRDPGDLAAWQSLAAAYLRQAADASDPSYYGLARRALGRAETLDAGNLGTRLGRAELALALHDFRGARRLATQVLADNPLSPEALGITVDANIELGDYTAGIDALERMLEVDPGLPALARVSYVRELHGELDSAVRALQQAETAGATTPAPRATVQALLGDLHRKRGDLAAAQAAYERALVSRPDLAAAEIGAALVLAAQGRTDAAVDALQAVTARSPQPAALAVLGDLLAGNGRQDEAEQAYALVEATARLQRAAGQDTDLDLALYIIDRSSDPRRALAIARRAYRGRPGNIYAADALAWALHRGGDDRAALPYARRALRLGSRDAGLHYHAAEVFAGTGRRAQAVRSLRTALAGDRVALLANREALERLAVRLDVELPDAW